jgi:hypothetical protein
VLTFLEINFDFDMRHSVYLYILSIVSVRTSRHFFPVDIGKIKMRAHLCKMETFFRNSKICIQGVSFKN